MDISERIVIVASKHDKALLLEMMGRDGEASMSNFGRRLIRQEAERRNVTLPQVEEEQPLTK